jgi:hypothetical protein
MAGDGAAGGVGFSSSSAMSRMAFLTLVFARAPRGAAEAVDLRTVAPVYF